MQGEFNLMTTRLASEACNSWNLEGRKRPQARIKLYMSAVNSMLQSSKPSKIHAENAEPQLKVIDLSYIVLSSLVRPLF